ncbi:hypothetical protein QR680_009222 [Steinernema hermaphroditum]|uniref:Transducer of regulated CREB activity N-terminal domain-containing protein n=1 Tax=Steinernema hermaphroditum TaxID=289476 RepID=A0AA39ILV1_9BILA|nr:hypothetical protein QR680_009222 [Steinernema hermaphroditum]
MAQGTPRKFSEKIAIMERKQNEDQEAFCSVLREVRAITNSATTMGSASPGPQMPASPGHSGMGPGLGPTALAPPVHWNRSGGSLPNVHQMSQMQMPMYPASPGSWSPHGGFWQVSQGAHPGRGRSPGPHYHPYGQKQHKYSAERVPSLDYNMPCPPVHLQPPDSHWPNFRAVSDPAIHANAYQQPQQPMVAPNSVESYYPDSPASSSQMYQMNNHHPQQNDVSAAFYDSPQMPRHETPVGSLPNMNSPVFSPNFSMYNQHQQNLSTPATPIDMSQSAPTSPSSQSHLAYNGSGPNFSGHRHFSTSPDTRDIPNIILTGTDGQLDVFQDLNINETQLKQLLLDPASEAVDPACENALLN